jgi:cytoskeletal protein CcmA (bactofilin family)
LGIVRLSVRGEIRRGEPQEGQGIMRPGEITTIIGRSATFRGELSSTDDLQIDGSFEGTIRQSSGRLTIGAEARVQASIVAPDVVVFGRVEGDIRATGRVDLRSTAVVLGDIFAGRLSMEENASLRGQVDPTRAGETAPPVASVSPKATRQASSAAAGGLGSPRKPDLFDSETGSSIQQGRQMPSALAAFAAAARQESNPESATPRNEDEDGGSTH